MLANFAAPCRGAIRQMKRLVRWALMSQMEGVLGGGFLGGMFQVVTRKQDRACFLLGALSPSPRIAWRKELLDRFLRQGAHTF